MLILINTYPQFLPVSAKIWLHLNKYTYRIIMSKAKLQNYWSWRRYQLHVMYLLSSTDQTCPLASPLFLARFDLMQTGISGRDVRRTRSADLFYFSFPPPPTHLLGKSCLQRNVHFLTPFLWIRDQRSRIFLIFNFPLESCHIKFTFPEWIFNFPKIINEQFLTQFKTLYVHLLLL